MHFVCCYTFRIRPSLLGRSKQDSVSPVGMQNHLPRPDCNGLPHLFKALRVPQDCSPFLVQGPRSSAVTPGGPCFGLPAEDRPPPTSLAFSRGEGQARVQGGPSSHANLRWPAQRRELDREKVDMPSLWKTGKKYLGLARQPPPPQRSSGLPVRTTLGTDWLLKALPALALHACSVHSREKLKWSAVHERDCTALGFKEAKILGSVLGLTLAAFEIVSW